MKENNTNGCDIRVYSLSTCIHCRDAKKFLDECGVKYDCVNVDKLNGEERMQALEAMRQVNPGCSFPTIIIKNRTIVGFRRDQIEEALQI